MHTGGEPLRIPIAGLPEIKGGSVLEKRKYFMNKYDHLRTGLMFEPRGHADMYGAILSDPSTEDADFDVFFIHNEGYSTMCGHAIIALTKFVFETKLLIPKKESQLTINVPAGKIRSTARIEDGLVVESSFINVPSYLYLRDKWVYIKHILKPDTEFPSEKNLRDLINTHLRLSVKVGYHYGEATNLQITAEECRFIKKWGPEFEE